MEADSPNGSAPANYRWALALVIILGVLLCIGVGALIGGAVFSLRGDRTTGEPYLSTLPASPNAAISGAQLDGPRLLVRLDGGGDNGGEVVVLEAATGRVIGRISLERAP